MTRRTLFKTLLGLAGFSALPKPVESAQRQFLRVYDLGPKLRITMFASGNGGVGEVWKTMNVDETWEFKRDSDGVCYSKRIG